MEHGMEHVVVVGAGQAGVQVADSLRTRGYTGALTLVGAEPELPYQRPPLSKDFLAADGDPGPLPLRAERFFAEHQIVLRTGATVTNVDRDRHTVVLDDGELVQYSALVLATGATNRTLPVAGADLAGVHHLRTLDDAQRLRAALTTARSVVVVGAGFIGLEFAAVAVKRGVAVTVLESAARPMGRGLSPQMSDYFTGAHLQMGTDLRLGEGLAALSGASGAVTAAVGSEEVLRQWRPLVRQLRLGADERESACVAPRAQGVGDLDPGLPGTDDHDVFHAVPQTSFDGTSTCISSSARPTTTWQPSRLR